MSYFDGRSASRRCGRADAEPGTDDAAVRDGLVSITPLRFDHTAEEMLGELRKWARSI